MDNDYMDERMYWINEGIKKLLIVSARAIGYDGDLGAKQWTESEMALIKAIDDMIETYHYDKIAELLQDEYLSK